MAVVRRLVLMVMVVCGVVPLTASGAPLLIRFESYPPFVWDDEGTVRGKFADHTRKIAKAAGQKLMWRKGTYKRIMRDLYDNVGQFCVTGYSYSASRAHLVRYTQPYGRFPPSGIAVRQENLSMFKYHAHIFDVLADSAISGAFIEGANYGEEFNRRVAAGKRRHLHISGGDEDLVFLLAKGRVHFAMINEAQVDHFKSRIEGAETLVALSPDGMSAGSEVHMLCTKNVSSDVLGRLNAAIEHVGALP